MEEKNFPEEISPEPDKNHPVEKLSVKLKKVFYKELIVAYQSSAKSKKLKQEAEIWEEALEDIK